jgi:hypothetical protein
MHHNTLEDGYVHPLDIISVDFPMSACMCPYMDDEWDTLPYIIWMSDVE